MSMNFLTGMQIRQFKKIPVKGFRFSQRLFREFRSHFGSSLCVPLAPQVLCAQYCAPAEHFVVVGLLPANGV